MKKSRLGFSRGELALWATSVLIICAVFLIFARNDTLTLAASLIGVTSLLFTAKGNPIGQLLMIVFSIMYGIISYGFSYYGEMLTYLAMTAPMALFSLIAWLRHPYRGENKQSRSEVEVNSISRTEVLLASLLTAAVTVVFFFILRALSTANLAPSTVSVITSFLAVYLTARRSPYYALAYAANDIVLIVLWVMASFENTSYISVTVCFTVFFVCDLYGFVCWQRMKRRQAK